MLPGVAHRHRHTEYFPLPPDPAQTLVQDREMANVPTKDDFGFRCSAVFAVDQDGETLPRPTCILSARHSSPTCLLLRLPPSAKNALQYIPVLSCASSKVSKTRLVLGETPCTQPFRAARLCVWHACVRAHFWRSIKQVSGCVSICSREGSDSPII